MSSPREIFSNTTPCISGFLSEMSAEPIHGGGITLHRVLQEDFAEIRWFAKVLHFSQQPIPAYSPEVKSLLYPWWNHERLLRRVIGSRLACAAANAGLVRRAFASRVVADLRRKAPQLYDEPFLVCPQADISLFVIEELKRRGNLRYVTWMMDDHLVRWRNGKWVYPPGIEPILSAHFRDAAAIFVISEEMSDFYRERFGVQSLVLHSPAPQPTEFPLQAGGDNDGALRLAYFGALGRWQNDAIGLLAPAISNNACTLDVYTRDSDNLPECLRIPGVQIVSPIPAADVQAAASRYNAVVLPISFRDELRNMSHFNIATKFSESLGGPVPTLIIGPPDAAMVRICRRFQCAAVVDHASSECVTQALEGLKSHVVRQNLLGAAHALTESEFSSRVMRSRWLSATWAR